MNTHNYTQYSDILATDMSKTHQAYTHTDMHSSCMNACMNENTHPGVFCFPSAEELQELCSLYEGCIGVPLNNASAAIIEEWFERMELQLICEAIRRTGIYARRPGAPYIRAILKNWDSQGIHSIFDLQNKEKVRIQAKTHQSAMKPWWNQAQNYQQHPFNEETCGKTSYSDPTMPIG